MQFEESVPWIPALNVYYQVGVDGISVPFVFLTALLTTLCLFYSSYTINERVKEFFALFLLLEMGMFGVFISLDFVLFYVFWEIGLVPMYLLIGIWGGKTGLYAAIKFFLYTLVGQRGHAAGHPGLYFNTGHLRHPGDRREVRRGAPVRARTSPRSAWRSGPSSWPSPSRCPASPSTPGCPTRTPKRPPPAASSWPASC